MRHGRERDREGKRDGNGSDTRGSERGRVCETGRGRGSDTWRVCKTGRGRGTNRYIF